MEAGLSGLLGAIVLPWDPSWVFWTVVVGVALLWAFVGVCELVAWRRRKDV